MLGQSLIAQAIKLAPRHITRELNVPYLIEKRDELRLAQLLNLLHDLIDLVFHGVNPSTNNQKLINGWQTVAVDTERGFAWLCRDIAADEPVTFVTNPGNVGDALINLSCYRNLADHFAGVSVCSVRDTPRTDCLFLAGGGNRGPVYRCFGFRRRP